MFFTTGLIRDNQVKIAVRASLACNVALAVLQRQLKSLITSSFFLVDFRVVYGAISSASLSLLATGIDSVFDVGSNILLYYIHRKSSRMDVNKWPVGGARLETIGNVIYGNILPYALS